MMTATGMCVLGVAKFRESVVNVAVMSYYTKVFCCQSCPGGMLQVDLRGVSDAVAAAQAMEEARGAGWRVTSRGLGDTCPACQGVEP